MSREYPNPCDGCPSCTDPGNGCLAWRIRYRYRQKQINAYSKQLYAQEKKKTKFVYMHPDQLRRYLQDGPCKGCNAEQACDTHCPAYLSWWDMRMAVARKKANK